MSHMNDAAWDAVEKAATATESFGVRANFGKLSIGVDRMIRWQEGMPHEITPEQYAELPAKETQLDLKFSVDVREFNPDLDFTYDRKVAVGRVDWRKTLKPSVEAVMGKGTMKEGSYAQTLKQLDGKYVEVHDVPQLKLVDGKEVEQEFNTIKIVRVFADRDECFAAWGERFASGSDAPNPTQSSGGVDIPEAYGDLATWQSVIPDIKKALASGKSKPEVASDYGVQIKHVIQAENA